jgi:hypothetical protein
VMNSFFLLLLRPERGLERRSWAPSLASLWARTGELGQQPLRILRIRGVIYVCELRQVLCPLPGIVQKSQCPWLIFTNFKSLWLSCKITHQKTGFITPVVDENLLTFWNKFANIYRPNPECRKQIQTNPISTAKL